MTKFKKIVEEIQEELALIKYDEGDLADIGNHIGYVIAKHFDDSGVNNKNAFLVGLNHGISISDGTHG